MYLCDVCHKYLQFLNCHNGNSLDYTVLHFTFLVEGCFILIDFLLFNL